jgi:hypothetical protein
MSVPKKVRKPPMLIEVGDRQVISSGRWNDQVMADYALLHCRDEWGDIGELARLVFRNNSEARRKYVRHRLSKLFNYLFDNHGQMLVVEYNGPNHSASAIKIYDGKTEAERQAMRARLAKMKQAGDIRADKYNRCLELLVAQEQGATAGTE